MTQRGTRERKTRMVVHNFKKVRVMITSILASKHVAATSLPRVPQPHNIAHNTQSHAIPHLPQTPPP
jgi:hypothetical protein